MTRDRIHSVITEGIDLEMTVALGGFVNAVCGKRWIPTLVGDNELAGLPKCTDCFPTDVRRKASVKTDAPVPHFVYRHYDAIGRLVYVGITNNPVTRLKTHRKSSWWFEQVTSSRMTVFPDRSYGLTKEREAIRVERPRWNVKGRWSTRSDIWTPDDYTDLRHAILQAIDTTHGVHTDNTRKLVADIDAELEARFGVTALNRRPA